MIAPFANSERFQKCIRENKHQKSYHALYDKSPFIKRLPARINLNVACAAGDTDVLTALAGIIVAFFTCTLWVSTHRLWKAGEQQIAAASAAAVAAKQAADIAQATLRAGYRPWLHFTAKPDGPIYSDPYHTGANFNVKVKNVGSAPAINVIVKAVLIPTRDPLTTSGIRLTATPTRLMEICKTQETLESRVFNMFVFPGGKEKFLVGVETQGGAFDQKFTIGEAFIFITYQTPGDNLIHHTLRCFITLIDSSVVVEEGNEAPLTCIGSGGYAD